MAVEDIAGAQAADHSKKGELSEFQESCEGKASTHKVDERFGGIYSYIKATLILPLLQPYVVMVLTGERPTLLQSTIV